MTALVKSTTPISHVVEAVVEETIKLTVWRNIRRYILLGGIGFVIIDLVITLAIVLVLASATRHSDLVHAQVACRNTATIARIEHTTVAQQARNTASLVKQGFTFGLPKAQFNRLLAQSHNQQQRYLTALDGLAKTNCHGLK